MEVANTDPVSEQEDMGALTHPSRNNLQLFICDLPDGSSSQQFHVLLVYFSSYWYREEKFGPEKEAVLPVSRWPVNPRRWSP